MFRKGERDQLCDIRRRKAWSTKQQPNARQTQNIGKDQSDNDDQRSSSTSSTSEFSHLVNENKRLKQENEFLSSELEIMKKKCNELLHLVAICGCNNVKSKEADEPEDPYEGPKLFGVRLDHEVEKKRKREEISSARVVFSQSCK